jgi:hypothetical protein
VGKYVTRGQGDNKIVRLTVQFGSVEVRAAQLRPRTIVFKLAQGTREKEYKRSERVGDLYKEVRVTRGASRCRQAWTRRDATPVPRVS